MMGHALQTQNSPPAGVAQPRQPRGKVLKPYNDAARRAPCHLGKKSQTPTVYNFPLFP